MKSKLFKTITILSTVVALSACQTSSFKGVTQLRSPEELLHSFDYSKYHQDANYQTFKAKMQLFAAKLSESFVSRKYDSNKNITFSPLSIEMCLGLAIYSASGETRQELLNALDVDFETFNKYYRVFFDDLIF